VNTERLLFEDTERGLGEELRLRFKALSTMPAEEGELARGVLQAILRKSQGSGAVKQFGSAPAAKKPAARERVRA
jgi:hypothetical protein